MKRGISPIVAVVLLIAIAVIAAVGLYFWVGGMATKQPTPQKPNVITAVKVTVTDPDGQKVTGLLVQNLGESDISLGSTLMGGRRYHLLYSSEPGIYCDFPDTDTIAAGTQERCYIVKITGSGDAVSVGTTTYTGTLAFYTSTYSSTSSAIIQLSNDVIALHQLYESGVGV